MSPDDAIIEHFRLTVSVERLDDIFSTFDQMDHAHPAYLENTNPRNRSFYERHGFVTTGESQAGGPHRYSRWCARPDSRCRWRADRTPCGLVVPGVRLASDDDRIAIASTLADACGASSNTCAGPPTRESRSSALMR